MAITIPIPPDTVLDHVPIAGPQVQVGTDLLSVWTVEGRVISRTDKGVDGWTYLLDAIGPDGQPYVEGIAWSGPVQPSDWWQRQALWHRAAKPTDGGPGTGRDGSRWLYPTGEDGRMHCYVAGTVNPRGSRRFRGELTTNPDDLWIGDDPTWDWLPVADGSEVALGDTIRFLSSIADVVSVIGQTTSPYGRTVSFLNGTGSQMGWWFEAYQTIPGTIVNGWTFFERMLKPAEDDLFVAPDGSRWVFTGGICYCWGRGSIYPPGVSLQRGEILGGLKVLDRTDQYQAAPQFAWPLIAPARPH